MRFPPHNLGLDFGLVDNRAIGLGNFPYDIASGRYEVYDVIVIFLRIGKHSAYFIAVA
ncbi:MAG: hypothetical protein ACKO7N_02635 [Candidatus Nitrosotenuis sp.]